MNILAITGPPCVGKSFLVAELSRRITPTPFVINTGTLANQDATADEKRALQAGLMYPDHKMCRAIERCLLSLGYSAPPFPFTVLDGSPRYRRQVALLRNWSEVARKLVRVAVLDCNHDQLISQARRRSADAQPGPAFWPRLHHWYGQQYQEVVGACIEFGLPYEVVNVTDAVPQLLSWMEAK